MVANRSFPWIFALLAALLLSAACDSTSNATATATADTGTDADTVAQTDAQTDADTDTVADTGTVVDTGADTETVVDTIADTAPFPCDGAPDGTPCDDGDPCTWDDRCLANTCMAGSWDSCLGGSCGPAMPLGCNLEVVGSTAGAPAHVTDWGCTDAPALPGPERVYRFQAPYLLSATVALVPQAEDLRLVVLRPSGGNCEPGSCESSLHLGAAIEADPGEVLYLVVDGEETAGADFKIAIGCPLPTAELACGDGEDNDSDGATDCDDDDCPDDPHCNGTAGVCEYNYFIICGLEEIWSTGSTSASNTNENYACSSEDFSGPEYIYQLRVAEPQTAIATLGDPDPWEPLPTAQILVLEGSCSPEACIAAGTPSVEVSMQADTDYFFIVDATRALSGFFHISIDCQP